ncbi:hypothetical protein IV81_GL000872 [Pediococcus stilesii]|uniref:Preprotein translocase subunit YajC n=2 Tax=Pediococcus stilesii TaxID=331679 RepID=A0A0R2KUM5_9LACO|nr:hypothetical protein IV81_GL000872 [Pediococcus stilesii]
MRNAQEKLQRFYNSLSTGDTIVLSDGIKGQITGIDGEFYKVRIAENVEVELNKFGIVNKLGDSK